MEEALKQHEYVPPPPEQGDNQQHPISDGMVEDTPAEESPAVPKYTRTPDPDRVDPIERFKKAKAAGDESESWGQGETGYKPPRSVDDKLK